VHSSKIREGVCEKFDQRMGFEWRDQPLKWDVQKTGFFNDNFYFFVKEKELLDLFF